MAVSSGLGLCNSDLLQGGLTPGGPSPRAGRPQPHSPRRRSGHRIQPHRLSLRPVPALDPSLWPGRHKALTGWGPGSQPGGLRPLGTERAQQGFLKEREGRLPDAPAGWGDWQVSPRVGSGCGQKPGLDPADLTGPCPGRDLAPPGSRGQAPGKVAPTAERLSCPASCANSSWFSRSCSGCPSTHPLRVVPVSAPGLMNRRF